MSARTRPRWAEIDLLKGLAILWVLLIHSRALGDSAGFLYVVNRAVPLFVILFGLNSTLWWRSRPFPQALSHWYSTRAKRILVPYWATLPVWWALALHIRPYGIELHWWLPFVQVAGYTAAIGTGWFVTLVLLLAALFPWIEAAVRRVGPWPVLAVAMAGELVVESVRGEMLERIGLMNLMAFPPRVLGHVVFGMLLARWIGRIGPAAGFAGAALWALCAVVQRSQFSPALSAIAAVMIDFPLVVALLAVLRPLAAVPVLAPALTWLGISSWGVYLGQMLVHNAVIFRCGFTSDLVPNLTGCNFPFPGSLDRWVYTLVLLIGAIGFIGLGEQALRIYGALRRSGVPLPDLAR